MLSSDAEKQSRIEQLYAVSRKRFPEVADLSVEELDRLRESSEVVLIDVRNPPEQAVSMIPGAITAAKFEAEPLTYASATLVTYCTIGHRSGLYARKLQRGGYKVFNLKGAILSWTHAAKELVNSTGPTKKVHVGGPNWSLEAADYEPTW